MNTRIQLVASALTMAAAFAMAAPSVGGAEKGAWTQDYDAALAAAKAESLPVLVNFTGSDWCGWCKLMDRQVFSTKEWKEWAKDRIYLAFIDFPRDGSLVPKKFVKRNDELAKKFGIRGYPTYIILNGATGEKIGQLGASRDATPEDFIAKLAAILKSMEESAPAAANAE